MADTIEKPEATETPSPPAPPATPASPAAPPEPPKPEPREEPKAETAWEECPDCGAYFKREKLGAHRFTSHQIDRRAKPTTKSDALDNDPKKTRTPPKKEPTKTSEPQKKKSRWSEVGW